MSMLNSNKPLVVAASAGLGAATLGLQFGAVGLGAGYLINRGHRKRGEKVQHSSGFYGRRAAMYGAGIGGALGLVRNAFI